MLTYANQLAPVVSEAEQELGCKDDRVSGELSFGVSATIAEYVLARLLGAFLAEYPNIECELHTGNTSQIVGLLLVGKVSVGLIEGPGRDRGVRSEPFMEDELVPIAPLDTSLSRNMLRNLQRAPARAPRTAVWLKQWGDAVTQLRTGTGDL